MIVRYRVQWLHRHDHSKRSAQVSGLFATHWGNQNFQKPRPYKSLVRAAMFHDRGWIRYETGPQLDPQTGKTPNYRQVPNDQAQLDAFEWAGDWLSAIDPYAMLGAAENTGLALRTVSIPLEDAKVGTTLAVRKSYVTSNPKEVAGYCRAMTKGLVFTMTNRAAAFACFGKRFPTAKPANLDDATALKNGVHIMDRFLEKALQDQADGARLRRVHQDELAEHARGYVKLGTLKGAEAPNNSFTEQFIAACNDSIAQLIVAQAKACNRPAVIEPGLVHRFAVGYEQHGRRARRGPCSAIVQSKPAVQRVSKS